MVATATGTSHQFRSAIIVSVGSAQPGHTELAIDSRSASLYKGRPVRHAPSASARRAVSLTVRASSVFVVLI